jgi:15-cis-phytoene synthase
MIALFNEVSAECSKITTRKYSTSFSLGIYFLHKKLHEPIYAIYGFVRFADEIVDTFHEYNKEKLLADFKEQTFTAIREGISLNPILNSFQKVVNQYGIDDELILTFLKSMQMDLNKEFHNQQSYQEYILGSAEVVGLMCLKVFCEGNKVLYESLKSSAMSLGAAFQKINFLRDLNQDYYDLKRTYFPGLNLENFGETQKRKIEEEIKQDFLNALEGIKRLPSTARLGVYTAYIYYFALFKKIQGTPAPKVLHKRIRIPNNLKILLLVNAFIKYRCNTL